jgi:hypothetical protein
LALGVGADKLSQIVGGKLPICAASNLDVLKDFFAAIFNGSRYDLEFVKL